MYLAHLWEESFDDDDDFLDDVLDPLKYGGGRDDMPSLGKEIEPDGLFPDQERTDGAISVTIFAPWNNNADGPAWKERTDQINFRVIDILKISATVPKIALYDAKRGQDVSKEAFGKILVQYDPNQKVELVDGVCKQRPAFKTRFQYFADIENSREWDARDDQKTGAECPPQDQSRNRTSIKAML